MGVGQTGAKGGGVGNTGYLVLRFCWGPRRESHFLIWLVGPLFGLLLLQKSGSRD